MQMGLKSESYANLRVIHTKIGISQNCLRDVHSAFESFQLLEVPTAPPLPRPLLPFSNDCNFYVW